MSHSERGTKQDLIMAAGELFAEHGFAGTSIRAIAEKAGANIAAINYHFGSKDHLHTEVLRFVIQQMGCEATFVNTLLENPELFESRETIAEMVQKIVSNQFETHFSVDHPDWFAQVMIQSVIRPSSSLTEIVNDHFKPDHDALRAFAHKANPTLSDQEIDLWTFTLKGQIVFFVIAQYAIFTLRREDRYDPSFLKAAADYISQAVTATLFKHNIES